VIAPSASVRFAAPSEVFGRIAGASRVALSAYTLEPRGEMVRALDAAASRGARVSATLEGFSGRADARDLRRVALANARDLRAHGVRVRLGTGGRDAVHLKAAVVDGTAFLDDRNWAARGETIVATTDPGEVGAVRDAIDGRPRDAGALATDKRSALEREAEAIRRGGDHVDLETESFGPGIVATALRERAAGGAHVRLLVNDHIASETRARGERALLRELARAGVEVHVSCASEKLCVAGDRGWVGSANATSAGEPMTDWGLTVEDPSLLGTLATTFERNWTASRPWPHVSTNRTDP
jgi:phosphatidylserine/phosphatidylglycerophosphate/cardiolipin synthase-like enzyme